MRDCDRVISIPESLLAPGSFGKQSPIDLGKIPIKKACATQAFSSVWFIRLPVKPKTQRMDGATRRLRSSLANDSAIVHPRHHRGFRGRHRVPRDRPVHRVRAFAVPGT